MGSDMTGLMVNDSILIEQSGELIVRKEIIKNINLQLCGLFRCNHINKTYDKIKKQSKIRLKTNNTFYPEVFSVTKGIVKTWTRSLSLVSVPGLYSDLDLVKGTYEGGFKVWESTRDLVKFLTEDESIISELLHRKSSKFRCIELGAGASLPTLSLMNRMLQDPEFDSDYRFHVQDYNWQVLASLTLLNFAVNMPLDYLSALLETRCLRLFHGDWSKFNSGSKYDLIIMSEVIYNCDNYESLHNLLEKHLRSRGYIVIATKDTYFGLTGSLHTWTDFVSAKGVFSNSRMIKVSNYNIPRSILIMQKILK